TCYFKSWRFHPGTWRPRQAVFSNYRGWNTRGPRRPSIVDEPVERLARTQRRKSMTPKQPPRFATWMLKHFGSGPNIDAVLGDLAERYQEKNSAIWYWRQTIKA